MIQVPNVCQAGYAMVNKLKVFYSLKKSRSSRGPQGHECILKCPVI